MMSKLHNSLQKQYNNTIQYNENDVLDLSPKGSNLSSDLQMAMAAGVAGQNGLAVQEPVIRAHRRGGESV